VHEVLESLRNYPAEERFTRDLFADYDDAWSKVAGKAGGFRNEDEEAAAKEKGRIMIERVLAHPGPLTKKTVRLPAPENNMPPHFYLSEEDNIILCGLVDWLEYVEDDDSVRIIDFKTGKHKEEADSLQLPIYLLLLTALQKRVVSGAAYWYLDTDDAPVDASLPTADEACERVLHTARAVKKAREKRAFECPQGPDGCFACQPYEKILRGEAEYVGVGGYGQDTFIV
jgi:hypothetical protein